MRKIYINEEEALADFDNEHSDINETEIKIENLVNEQLNSEIVISESGQIAIEVQLPRKQGIGIMLLSSIINTIAKASGITTKELLKEVEEFNKLGAISNNPIPQ